MSAARLLHTQPDDGRSIYLQSSAVEQARPALQRLANDPKQPVPSRQPDKVRNRLAARFGIPIRG